MLRVYSARDSIDAHLVRGLLENRGIPAIVQGEALGATLGPLSPDTSPSVWIVNDADAERASALVEQGGGARPNFCPKCGYDLRGQIEGRCPECGRAFPDPPPWTCPTCGEKIEGQFAECWNCAPAGEAP